MSDSSKFYSTGRGGAGNFGQGSRPSEPTYAEEGSAVPQIKTDKFTTGRGGAGNMRSNNDAEVARHLQDVDGPAGYVPSENPTVSSASVGRGGYGNVIATQEAVEAEKQSFIQRVKGLFTSAPPSATPSSNKTAATAKADSYGISSAGPSSA